MKECYYSILGVEPTASSEEIKKAYRKKALKMHPDKVMQSASSLDDIQIAQINEAFNSLQEAFECLSNEHDRIWYDNNKSYILRKDALSSSKKSTEFMTKEDLVVYHLKSAFKGFATGNDPKSFYNVYGTLFANILVEEEKAIEMDLDHLAQFAPTLRVSFGNAEDLYEPDSNLFNFYLFFSNFSSCKSFNWFDVANPLDCHSRYEKRLAEKANKKSREEARKAFNQQVVELCRYVKSRDPRVKEGMKRLEEKKALEAQEKKRGEIEAARTRKELADMYVEPDWSKVSDDAVQEYLHDDNQSDYEEEYECIVCEKVFKSLKQLENHESSKRHLELLEEMKMQLQMEDLSLKDDEKSKSIPKTNEDIDTTEERIHFECLICSKSFENSLQLAAHEQSKKHRQTLKASKQKNTAAVTNNQAAVTNNQEELDGSVDKTATAKKKRRAEKGKDGKKSALVCNVCKSGFPSKTKLFNHIHETGHARA